MRASLLPAPEVGIWPRLPGYDEAEDSGEEEAEDASDSASASERLKDVLAVLGDRWKDVPIYHFDQAPSSFAAPRSQAGPGPRPYDPTAPQAYFQISHCDAPVVKDTLLYNGFSPTWHRDWALKWSGPGMDDSVYQDLNEYQRVNHFPGSTELTRKDRLWLNFQEMAQTFGSEAFDFVPETFVLPDQCEEFLERYWQSEALWIVKPHASSCGRGIFILQDIGELPLEERSVVSRYVANPLLIQGLKFDLRVYVLVTSYEPLRAYIFREGLTRFASAPYSTEGKEHLRDPYRHLTNYSINKRAGNFMENQEMEADNVGHKWSLSALNKHLECTGVDVNLMWTRINDLVLKTLLSVENIIAARTREACPHHRSCFELYGFDVLVDADLKPWLIEVNLSPSMQAESPLDWQIKSALLSEALNIVGICKVDRHAMELSRIRGRRSQPPPRPARPPATAPAALGLTAAGAAAAAAGALGGELRPVALESLAESQLHRLAHALQETGRCRNFLRLHPTRASTARYAGIAGARPRRGRPAADGRPPLSRLLAALLFGPRPGQPPEPQPLGNAPEEKQADAAQPPAAGARPRERQGVPAGAQLPSASAAASGRMPSCGEAGGAEGGPPASGGQPRARRVFEIMQYKAFRDLGAGEVCRLVLMEYLLRLARICASLGDAQQARLSRSATWPRLAAFKRQLLKGAEGEQRQSSAGPLVQGGCRELVEEVALLCRAHLSALLRGSRLLKTTPAAAAGMDSSGRDRGGGLEKLSKYMPASFAKSELGRRALAAIGGLSAADLEQLLQDFSALPQCKDFLEPFAGPPGGRRQPGAGVAPWRPPAGAAPAGAAGRPRSRGAASGGRLGGAEGRPSPGRFLGPLSELLRLPAEACGAPAACAGAPAGAAAEASGGAAGPAEGALADGFEEQEAGPSSGAGVAPGAVARPLQGASPGAGPEAVAWGAGQRASAAEQERLVKAQALQIAALQEQLLRAQDHAAIRSRSTGALAPMSVLASRGYLVGEAGTAAEGRRAAPSRPRSGFLRKKEVPELAPLPSVAPVDGQLWLADIEL